MLKPRIVGTQKVQHDTKTFIAYLILTSFKMLITNLNGLFLVTLGVGGHLIKQKFF